MPVTPKRAAQALAVGVVAVLGVVLVLRIAHSGGGVSAALDRGETVAAPALALPRLDGKGSISLAAYRGKAVVVNFFASWCLPCREEAPLLERTWREQRSQGLVVLGVDTGQDFRADARRFVREHGLTYPVVYDPKGSALGRWGVPGLPATFVVDRRGQVVSKVLGGLQVGDNAGTFRRDVRRALAR